MRKRITALVATGAVVVLGAVGIALWQAHSFSSFLTAFHGIGLALKDWSIFVASVAAVVWFFTTLGHKRRWSCNLEVTSLPYTEADKQAVEIRFLLENKGDRRLVVQRIEYMIDTLVRSDERLADHEVEEQGGMKWRLGKMRALHPKKKEISPRVLSGLGHTFTDCVTLPLDVHLIRVTARLNAYDPPASASTKLLYPAKATFRRHFPLPSSERPGTPVR